ncbi:MAG: Tic20 family protein [Pseudanabaenaceae cyanobacterium]
MTWRGNIMGIDRLWGCLPYLLPMSQAVYFGLFLFVQVPILHTIFMPLMQISELLDYSILPPLVDLGLIVFICLYALVVRNTRLHHFVRFNAMQALLLSIGLYLLLLVLRLFAPVLEVVPTETLLFIFQILASTLFIGMNGICLYSIVQSVRGHYAEIPIISEAAYFQVRF